MAILCSAALFFNNPRTTIGCFFSLSKKGLTFLDSKFVVKDWIAQTRWKIGVEMTLNNSSILPAHKGW